MWMLMQNWTAIWRLQGGYEYLAKYAISESRLAPAFLISNVERYGYSALHDEKTKRITTLVRKQLLRSKYFETGYRNFISYCQKHSVQFPFWKLNFSYRMKALILPFLWSRWNFTKLSKYSLENGRLNSIEEVFPLAENQICLASLIQFTWYFNRTAEHKSSPLSSFTVVDSCTKE